QVVIDHVQRHADILLVASIHQSLQPRQTAIGILRAKRENAVVTPVPPPGKLRHRHEFDRGHSELFQIAQPRKDRLEGAFGSERSHVNFVEYELANRQPPPSTIAPLEFAWRDYLGG